MSGLNPAPPATQMALNGHRSDPVAISRAAVEALSTQLQEPAWLREQRLAAFATYESLPLPKWSRGIGQWWTTDISAVKLENLQVYTAPAADHQPPDAFSTQEEHAGLIVSSQGGPLSSHLRADLAARGVIFTDLATAVREHGPLVQKYLSQAIPVNADKFTALNGALWNGGIFLYVPRGVAVDLPLHGLTTIGHTGGVTLHHTIIVAEPGSEVRLVAKRPTVVLACGSATVALENEIGREIFVRS